jgi:Domain of unknown function (DUF4386)
VKLLSPRARARLSGVFEALEGLPAVFGQTIVLGMLVVNGDPAATARNVIGCSIQAVAAVVYLSPLIVLLSDAHHGNVAMLLINMSRLTFDVYLIFFGFWCALLGYLIVRSTFMQRLIGALLILDGIGWMTFLVPPVATSIYALIAVVAGLAEFSLLLWMLIFGVNNERWRAQGLATKSTSAVA